MVSRIAVVTGAAEGLGRAIAQHLAEDGYDIVLADIAPSTETAKLVEKAGQQATEVICDVTSQESVRGLADRVEQLGGCDVLVNNAGIYPFVMFEDLSFEQFRRILS